MPTHNVHSLKAAGAIAFLLALCVAIALSLGNAADANAATKCSLKGKKLGPTYVTSLTVSGTSCANGYKLVTAYYKCRVKNGKKGKCTSKPLGYSCTERRSNAIPTQFDAAVTCRKSKATITHKYTQYT